VRRYHLFQAYNSGPLRLDRLPEVLGAVIAMLGERPWHGFAYGLALLPLLALDRRLRPAAAVIGIQLLFYLYVYLSVRIDAVMLVQASFQRLVLHLLPAVLTGAAIALERRSTAAGGRLTAAAAPAGESAERDTTARRSGAESA
jgi:apolipoprotein N-acyltransferase